MKFLEVYNNLSISELIFFYLIVITFIIQLFYIIFFYIRFVFSKHKTKRIKSSELLPVSIVIAAKNEAKNLKKFLPSILEQDYPNYEVIVVNDASVDNSEEILAKFKQRYPNLYFTNIPANNKFKHGKKLALTIGIKAAKYEYLIFTDADCQPVSKNWIKTMISNFDQQTIFVIGYGGYMSQKGLLNKLIRTDTIFIALNYFSYAKNGIPYMGVGRNMAFRKSFFEKVKGYIKYWYLLSGSDDLFINQHANKKNLKFETDKESFVLSVPKKTLKDYINQKIRHYSTAKYYKTKHKILLQTEYFSRGLFFISVIFAIVSKNLHILAISLYSFRLLLMIIIFIKTNKIFNEKKVLLMEILYDFFQLPFQLFIYLKKIFRKKSNDYIWK